jgi:hypothetical protein
VLLRAVEPDDHQRVTGCEVVLRRDERRGRRVHGRRDEHAAGLGQTRDGVPARPERLTALVETPEQQPEMHLRADLVQGELELGDDAEVAAAAA